MLIVGAECLVRGAVRLAVGLRVRPLIVGLSVVALGSSAPQLAVSLQATYAGTPDMALGSVMGGNTFSLLVTLGLCALVIPLRVSRLLVRLDIPLMFGASLLVFILAFNGHLERLDGLILLAALGVYVTLLWRQSRDHGRTWPTHSRPMAWPACVALMVVGVALLVSGGNLLLEAAVEVALDLGLSDRVIGLSIIAASTSLPALATSLMAAVRGERDIAAGNVIGSTLFNLLGVLGLTALLAPTPLSVSPNALAFDLPVMLGAAALCLPLFYSGNRLTRLEGLILLGLYLAYGLHVVTFATGQPLADTVERGVLFYVLPPLLLFVLFNSWRTWRRQH